MQKCNVYNGNDRFFVPSFSFSFAIIWKVQTTKCRTIAISAILCFLQPSSCGGRYTYLTTPPPPELYTLVQSATMLPILRIRKGKSSSSSMRISWQLCKEERCKHVSRLGVHEFVSPLAVVASGYKARLIAAQCCQTPRITPHSWNIDLIPLNSQNCLRVIFKRFKCRKTCVVV